jgi:hypothetical protein
MGSIAHPETRRDWAGKAANYFGKTAREGRRRRAAGKSMTAGLLAPQAVATWLSSAESVGRLYSTVMATRNGAEVLLAEMKSMRVIWTSGVGLSQVVL